MKSLNHFLECEQPLLYWYMMRWSPPLNKGVYQPHSSLAFCVTLNRHHDCVMNSFLFPDRQRHRCEEAQKKGKNQTPPPTPFMPSLFLWVVYLFSSTCSFTQSCV